MYLAKLRFVLYIMDKYYVYKDNITLLIYRFFAISYGFYKYIYTIFIKSKTCSSKFIYLMPLLLT